MSGRRMDYLYSRVEYAEFEKNTPERVAFAEHLKKVAKALHDIEWVDSSDYGPGDENEAIMTCITKDELTESLLETHAEIAERLSDLLSSTPGDLTDSIKQLAITFKEHKQNERHQNVAETRYWLDQNKLLISGFLAHHGLIEGQEHGA